MQKTIYSGTVFIKDGTPLPEGLRVETQRFATGWTLIKYPDGYGLSRAILQAGWTFFCLATEISATAFGFDEENTERKAVRRILENAKSKSFNSLEIARVASNRFLGVFYTTVHARSRHVKESIYLHGDEGDQQWIQGSSSNGAHESPSDASELPIELASRPS
jgi:hypothetical protein